MSEATALETPGEASTHKSGPTTFESFPISNEVKAAIATLGFSAPTEVQSAVIEPAIAGRDLVVQARTGSGKTSAFGIPLVERLPTGCGKAGEPAALVLVPTRELAQQVAGELRSLATNKQLRVQPIYGGAPLPRQAITLKAGIDIIVGTPGRLLDHIRRRNLSLGAARIVVLDEADEMLSMGFWDDVTELLRLSPSDRQTMLFSATLPYDVAKAAAQYLREPVRLDVSGDQLTVEGITNLYYTVLADLPKPRQLLFALENEQPDSAIVFCNTRSETDMIAKFLTQSGFMAEALSGNLRQKERERVMARIKSRDLRFMVATDVAARGIDIDDLSHVFNYALPEYSEVYLHRVGRTGRIGKMGAAVSLLDGPGLATLSRLQNEFGIRFTEKHLPSEESIIRTRSERIMKELAEKASVAEVGQHLSVAQQLVASPEASQIVAYLLKSYFNTQAAEAERRSHQNQGRGPLREGRPELANGEASAAEGGAEGHGRRRRRRRGRGRGERGERGERTSEPYYETMNAAEALATAPDASPEARAAVPAASSAAVGEAPAILPEGAAPAPAGEAAVADGLTRIRVNIGFDDGFKGRGSVAKRISALAGLNEGSVMEVESRRDHSVLKALPHIAELVVDRVDGTPIGKKILTVSLAQ